MNSRLKKLRKTLKLTQTEFGERIGVKGNTITGYENGTRTPSDAIVKAICREFGVNELWLRYGEEGGEMYQQKSREEELGALLKSVLADRPEAFRSRLLTALLRFDPDGAEWQVLERIYESIAEEAKKES